MKKSHNNFTQYSSLHWWASPFQTPAPEAAPDPLSAAPGEAHTHAPDNRVLQCDFPIQDSVFRRLFRIGVAPRAWSSASLLPCMLLLVRPASQGVKSPRYESFCSARDATSTFWFDANVVQLSPNRAVSTVSSLGVAFISTLCTKQASYLGDRGWSTLLANVITSSPYSLRVAC